MRPDQDKRLREMGPGEEACELCMILFYPGGSDEICDDCELNPARNKVGMEEFIAKALGRESQFSPEELLERKARMGRK